MSETDIDPALDTMSPETSLDEDDRMKPEFVAAVIAHVEAGDDEGARALVAPLHPADIADLFELVPGEMRRPLASAIADMLDGDVLAEMNEWVRDELIDALAPHEVAEIATQLDTDDAVAIIEELEEDEQRAVLRAMEPDDRAAIEEALSYPEESAGRLMQRELIAVPEHWTVGDVLDYLRRNEDLTTDFWEIFVVDMGHHPVGTCQLSWILRTPSGIAIADVMKREQTLIPVDMDQEEVALRFQKYALISAAVVDQAGRLVGMVTVDDIVHIIQEEAGEDILKLSGAGDGDINEPVLGSYKTRVRWLLANLLTALVASTIIGVFEGTIAKMVALATLMPIVAGVGGNAGTQTMAVTVRALATNQLTQSNTVRAVVREIRIALLNGLTVAGVIGVGVGLVFHNPALGAVIAAAMLANIVIAGLAGVLVPLTLDRMDVDPAVSSSIFVTMTTDLMGFLAFLGLATAAGLAGLSGGPHIAPVLHMTKIVFGCASLDISRDALGARADDGSVTISTRYRPTRFAEMVGGSLYWMIAHRLVARQTILAFEEAEGGRWHIRLDARLVPVRARPKRAHQGWRYLAPADAPEDFDGGEADVAAMPPAMISELSALMLI